MVKITDLNLAVKYGLNSQVWLGKNLAMGRLCSSSLILFLSFLRSQSCIDLPTHTCMRIFTCTGTHLILSKCRELRFWATEDYKQCRGKQKGRGIYNICCWAYILGILPWEWVSVAKEERQDLTCTWHSFCSELLPAVITSVSKLIFGKLVFIHHLSY